MEWNSLIIAIGIAVAGYFIGEGLRNFKNPKYSLNLLENDEHELIKESDVHFFIGISKQEAKSLVQEHPDIPHVMINGKMYFPKAKLRKWLMNLGK